MDSSSQRSLQQRQHKASALRRVPEESDITTPPQRRVDRSRADVGNAATQASQAPTPEGASHPEREGEYIDNDRIVHHATRPLEYTGREIHAQLEEVESGFLRQSGGQVLEGEGSLQGPLLTQPDTTMGAASGVNGSYSTGRWSYSEGDDVHIPPPAVAAAVAVVAAQLVPIAIAHTTAGLHQAPTGTLLALAATPQPVGSSAAYITPTPEQRQRMAARRLEALQRREESARKRARTTVRELFPGGDALNAPLVYKEAVINYNNNNINNNTAVCASPAAMQRAEANRAAALERRRIKLESEIYEMVRQSVAAGKGPQGDPVWRQRIEGDVRKYVASVRSHQVATAVGATATAAAIPCRVVTHQHGANGRAGTPLTPEQQQRAEVSKRAALERQQQRIEANVAEFMQNAKQKALATMEFGTRSGAPLH